MSNKVELLSKAMFKSMGSGNENIQKYFEDLDQVDRVNFFVHNYSAYSPSYLDLLMFSTKKYWEKFSLSQWGEVLRKSIGNELAVQYCISFLYRYIGIDSLKLFNELYGVDPEIKSSVLGYFEKNKGVLAIFDRIAMSELAKFKLQLSSFDEIRERLMKEGAFKADKISLDRISLPPS